MHIVVSARALSSVAPILESHGNLLAAESASIEGCSSRIQVDIYAVVSYTSRIFRSFTLSGKDAGVGALCVPRIILIGYLPSVYAEIN